MLLLSLFVEVKKKYNDLYIDEEVGESVFGFFEMVMWKLCVNFWRVYGDWYEDVNGLICCL